MNNGFGFNPFFALFGLVFVFIFVVIAVTIFRGLRQWGHNNAQPRIPAHAVVVSRRAHTSGVAGDAAAQTSYYATFEFDSGDRQEVHVSARDYALLADGDRGTLTLQGTRFITFERDR